MWFFFFLPIFFACLQPRVILCRTDTVHTKFVLNYLISFIMSFAPTTQCNIQTRVSLFLTVFFFFNMRQWLACLLQAVLVRRWRRRHAPDCHFDGSRWFIMFARRLGCCASVFPHEKKQNNPIKCSSSHCKQYPRVVAAGKADSSIKRNVLVPPHTSAYFRQIQSLIFFPSLRHASLCGGL